MSTHVDLIKHLKQSKALTKPHILKAFRAVDRKGFVPLEYQKHAYVDEPLPIGKGQTISQPWTVAFMTEALEPKAGQKILEIGSGSGWQAAILSKIAGKKGQIITLERLPFLYEFAKKNLINYKNVEVICADGSKGYDVEVPYDRIIVTAMAPNITQPLFEQLKEGGILVLPVHDTMVRVKKVKGKQVVESLGKFAFVPLIGEFGFAEA